MLMLADEQSTAKFVLLVTALVVLLVKVENHPAMSGAMATVNAIRRTAAMSGEIPFFCFIFCFIMSLVLYVKKQYIYFFSVFAGFFLVGLFVFPVAFSLSF